MTDSSSLSPSSLPITELEKGLKDAVATLNRAENGKYFTVNNVRKKAEALLGLDEGFYTTNAEWKQNSKRIIRAEVENLSALSASNVEEGNQFRPKAKPTKRDQSAPKANCASKKRSSPETDDSPRLTKKPRIGRTESESPTLLSSPPTTAIQSEVDAVKPPKRKRGRLARPSVRSGSPQEDEDGSDTIPKRNARHRSASKAKSHKPTEEKPVNATRNATNSKSKTATETGLSNLTQNEALDSQSELSSVQVMDTPPLKTEAQSGLINSSKDDMSVVLDEPSKPQKQRRRTKEPPSQGSKKAPRSKNKVGSDLSADDAEIKRLQGWLVKCGVRKLWGKELKPYETQEAKIKHLRQMLEDIGLTGRFSLEKAREVRERRELAADLAEVQDRAQRWGKADKSDADSSGKPKRRLIRESRVFDFLSDNDGEETD